MVKKTKTLTAGALSPPAFAHATGIVCTLALLMYATLTWFSTGFQSEIIVAKYPISFSFDSWTIILGLIESYVLAYIAGWIVAKVYNKQLVN